MCVRFETKIHHSAFRLRDSTDYLKTCSYILIVKKELLKINFYLALIICIFSSSQIWKYKSGSGSKLGQNSGSGSNFNVFGSTTLTVTYRYLLSVLNTVLIDYLHHTHRANLVERDPAPNGYQLVDPDKSGKRTQMDLGTYGTVVNSNHMRKRVFRECRRKIEKFRKIPGTSSFWLDACS